MPSETPLLDRLTAELVESLQAVLPSAWTIRSAEAKPERALGVILYHELGDLVNETGGRALPLGVLGATVTLTLVAPETDPEKGSARIGEAILALLPALDRIRTLYWDRAEKMRLPSGETAYRLEVIHLTRYTPTTTSPATAPETTEE